MRKLSKKQKKRLGKQNKQIDSPHILTIAFDNVKYFKIFGYTLPILHG